MSIDSIACLVAALALLSLALSASGPASTPTISLHEFQLANDAAEVLYKKGSLLEFAEYSEGLSPASQAPKAQADIEKITGLTSRCIKLSGSREISSCPLSNPITSTERLVPYSQGVARIRISIGSASINP